MGKSDAPAAPDYKGQAIAQANSGKYNEMTPYGSVGWSIRPGADPNNPQPGDYLRTTTLAPEQQQLYDTNVATQLKAGLAGQQMLGGIGDGQAASDAAYRRATRYYDTNFGRDESALRTQLINSGLTEGTEAYRNAMEQFNQRKDSAYSDAADRAVAAGDQQQNSAVARLANILAISRGQSPTSDNASGGNSTDLLNAANNQYQAQLGQVNADNAQAAGTTSALGSVAMMAAMYF